MQDFLYIADRNAHHPHLSLKGNCCNLSDLKYLSVRHSNQSPIKNKNYQKLLLIKLKVNGIEILSSLY